MSVDRVRLLRVLRCVTLLAAPIPGWAQGGSPAGSGVLSGQIVDRDGGQPVPFGTVLMADGRGTFANDQGAFRVTGLAPGSYAVRARQIGYAPVDTTLVIGGTAEATTVVFRLERLAFSLARIRVQGEENGCVPSPTPAIAQGTPLGMVLAQVHENVDRLRLLLDEYPFWYRRQEGKVRRTMGVGDSVVSVDTVAYQSRVRQPYRIGGIVYARYDALGKRSQYMYLPTLVDFADSAFLAAHCFRYAGVHAISPMSDSLVRIDFRPATRIRVPDVEGSVFLDARRFLLRRAVFRLTHPEAVSPPVVSLTVTTTYRELLPLVPIFDSTTVVQPLEATASAHRQITGFGGSTLPAETNPLRTESVEHYLLLDYAFERRTPGHEDATGVGGAMSETPRVQPARTDSAAGGESVLAGRVVDPAGTPVDAVTVGVAGTSDTAVTDPTGIFELRGIAPGAHMLTVRRFGFQPSRLAVSVSATRRVDLVVHLGPAVHRLPTVVTSAQVAAAYHDVGLDRRMREENGQFITYDQILHRHATQFTQLLQTLRGVHMFSYIYPDPATRVSATHGKGTCIGFMVDGVRQSMLTAHDIDEIIPPGNVGAVEYYHLAELPAGWRATAPASDSLPAINAYMAGPGSTPVATAPTISSCDVIAIWTRTRLGFPTEGPTDNGSGLASAVPAVPVFPNNAVCEPPPAEDTLDLLMTASLQSTPRSDPRDTIWQRYSEAVLSAFQRSFVAPAPLYVSAFSEAFFDPESADGRTADTHALAHTVPALNGAVDFELDSSGAVHSIRIGVSTLSPSVDTSFLAALETAAANHAYPAIPAALGTGHAQRLLLVISTGDQYVRAHRVPLARIAAPMWVLHRPATMQRDHQPDLAPRSAPTAAQADSVTLRFVVDERGRPALSTLRTLTDVAQDRSQPSAVSEHREFLVRALGALPQLRYDPALIGACSVPQTVTETLGWRSPKRE